MSQARISLAGRLLLGGLVLLGTLTCPRASASPVAPPAPTKAASSARANDLPPGFNVHLVRHHDGHRFYRGGAPRGDTFKALVSAARARGVIVTFIDLRRPPSTDDESGKGGRLTPAAEQKMATAEHVEYISVSALDKALLQTIDEALAKGDVYLHCMYGVNRTGFAIGRYATGRKHTVNREGLGERDYDQGEAFQKAQR